MNMGVARELPLAGVVMGLLAPVTPRVDRELVDVEELADLKPVVEQTGMQQGDQKNGTE